MDNMTYGELQSVAEGLGVPANAKRSLMLELIELKSKGCEKEFCGLLSDYENSRYIQRIIKQQTPSKRRKTKKSPSPQKCKEQYKQDSRINKINSEKRPKRSAAPSRLSLAKQSQDTPSRDPGVQAMVSANYYTEGHLMPELSGKLQPKGNALISPSQTNESTVTAASVNGPFDLAKNDNSHLYLGTQFQDYPLEPPSSMYELPCSPGRSYWDYYYGEHNFNYCNMDQTQKMMPIQVDQYSNITEPTTPNLLELTNSSHGSNEMVNMYSGPVSSCCASTSSSENDSSGRKEHTRKALACNTQGLSDPFSTVIDEMFAHPVEGYAFPEVPSRFTQNNTLSYSNIYNYLTSTEIQVQNMHTTTITEITESTQDYCRYQTYGCYVMLSGFELVYHELECDYQPVRCPYPSCNWYSNLFSLNTHLCQHRNTVVTSFQPLNRPSLCLCPNCGIWHTCSSSTPSGNTSSSSPSPTSESYFALEFSL